MSVQYKSAIERIKNNIREIPDFPEPGIVFRDITPILGNGQLFRLAITIFVERYQRRSIDKIVGIDARGFIFGSALAHFLGIGFVPMRKKGKLPFDVHSTDYALEYGTATLQVHTDAIKPGERVVIVDDLLATGGTAAAAAQLTELCGGAINEIAFLIELDPLKGRAKLEKWPVFSAIHY